MTIQKTLRGYQADLYRRLNRSRNNNKDAVMLLPTGAGKTAIARNHCSHILNHQAHFGIKRIIITTPQKQILKGFERTNNEEWFIKGTHSSQKIDNVIIDEIPNESIGEFLKGSSGGSIAISCIQSITNQRSNAFNPFLEIEDCSSILWVIDEAHHIEAEQTAIVIEEFKKKNGKILYLTATPFNANGALRILNDPNIEIIHRSLGEHMKDGFAPELDMTYEMFDVNAGRQTKYGYYNTTDLSKVGIWAECISKSYHKDNCPKTLIVIESLLKSIDGNVEDLDTQNAANHLKTELEKLNPGIKILVAVGNDSSGEISRNIEIEANTFPGHDIIIACKRFDEGTDVPSICAVYHIGMTGCRRIIQLMGRALRNKSAINGFKEKYPEYVDKSIFRFFIFDPTKSRDDKIDETQRDFSLQAIKTINAVQNFRSYDVISGAVRVRKNLQNKIEKLLEDDPENPDIEILEELVSEIEQPIISLETAGENDDSMLALLAHSKMDHTNEEALENSSEISKAYVESTLLSNELQTDDDVENFVERSVERKRIKRNSNVISEELQELVNKYANEKVKYLETDLVKRFVTSIDKNTLEEWGDVLWDTYDNEEKQLEQVKSIVKFYEENGKLPTNKISENLFERKLAQKLGQLKTVYNHPGTIKANIYKETLDYLKENDFLWIFDNRDLQEKQLNDIIDIVNFVDNNKFEPSQKSDDKNEKKLGIRLSHLRMMYSNKDASSIYETTIKYLQEKNMEGILNTKSNEIIQLNRFKDLVCFIKNNNRTPSQSSKDPQEKKLAQKLTSFRSVYSGNCKNRNIIYDTSLEYLESEKMLYILECDNYEKVQFDYANKIIEFYYKNNRLPTNDLDKDLSDKLKLIKLGLKNKKLGLKGIKIYDSTFNIFSNLNLMHLIEPIDRKEQQLNQIKEIVNYIKLNNKMPRNIGGDENESKMGKKLSCLRAAYNGKSNTGGWILYPETIDYLNSINMLHILDKQR